jgi:ankyrin repeat protein
MHHCTAAALLILAAAVGANGRTDAVAPVNKASSLQELVRASPLHHAAFWGEVERVRELLEQPSGGLCEPRPSRALSDEGDGKDQGERSGASENEDEDEDGEEDQEAHEDDLPQDSEHWQVCIDVNARLASTDTPLHIAVMRHKAEVVEVLSCCLFTLLLTSPPSARRESDGHLVSSSNSSVTCSSLQLLLKIARRHINASKADRNGVTPLHIACLHRDLRIVRALLDAGANPSAPDKHGAWPA